jgi:5-methylcytosine-specific restriction endonuclease McrA
MRALVAQLRKRKRAASDRPRNAARADAPAQQSVGKHRNAPARDSGSGHQAAHEGNAPARQSVGDHHPARVGDAPARDSGSGHRAPYEGAAPARRSDGGPREPSARNNRHIPSAIARAVWTRDENRCAYVDARGRRCRETLALELHHRIAFALGGPHTADNLEVRCRAHNMLAAEHDFGRARTERMHPPGLPRA